MGAWRGYCEGKSSCPDVSTTDKKQDIKPSMKSDITHTASKTRNALFETFRIGQ